MNVSLPIDREKASVFELLKKVILHLNYEHSTSNVQYPILNATLYSFIERGVE